MPSTSRSLILNILKDSSKCRRSLLNVHVSSSPIASHFTRLATSAPTCSTRFSHTLTPTQAPSHLFFTPTPSPRSRLGWYKDRVSSSSSSSHSSHSGTGRSGSGYGGGSSGGPFANLRRSFNRIPGEFLVWGIIGINGAVFFSWQYAIDQASRVRDWSTMKWLQDNVLLSWKNVREGRFWTILTCTFSHSMTAHILLNCLTFYFMAPPIIGLLGNTAFMGLYFFGGIASSLVSLSLNQSVLKREGASNGASGAIYAVLSFFACVSPRTKFVIFFVLPVPAWAAVGGFFLWDGFSTLTDRETRIDGAGHVGGILAGVAYYILKRRFMF